MFRTHSRLFKSKLPKNYTSSFITNQRKFLAGKSEFYKNMMNEEILT